MQQRSPGSHSLGPELGWLSAGKSPEPPAWATLEVVDVTSMHTVESQGRQEPGRKMGPTGPPQTQARSDLPGAPCAPEPLSLASSVSL